MHKVVGQNGTNKTVWKKWYGQNCTDKTVQIKTLISPAPTYKVRFSSILLSL